mmetsp:Transcript_27518/g.40475  ORF Transcript_27518/g.40475 Transcript_27518/m.40475 type:complete len:253 (-) Transcript_27518:52-810(-)
MASSRQALVTGRPPALWTIIGALAALAFQLRVAEWTTITVIVAWLSFSSSSVGSTTMSVEPPSIFSKRASVRQTGKAFTVRGLAGLSHSTTTPLSASSTAGIFVSRSAATATSRTASKMLPSQLRQVMVNVTDQAAAPCLIMSSSSSSTRVCRSVRVTKSEIASAWSSGRPAPFELPDCPISKTTTSLPAALPRMGGVNALSCTPATTDVLPTCTDAEPSAEEMMPAVHAVLRDSPKARASGRMPSARNLWR